MNLADGDLYLRLLLSAAPGVSVVGEDLGCDSGLRAPEHAPAGYPPVQPHWEIKSDGTITSGKEYHECSFAAFGTHDFETIMQTWNDSYAKIERAHKLGLWENGSPKTPSNPEQENMVRQAEGRSAPAEMVCGFLRHAA